MLTINRHQGKLVAVVIVAGALIALVAGLPSSKVASVSGLCVDIVGAWVLGSGLLQPPANTETTGDGQNIWAGWFFSEGQKDAVLGLQLIALGFVGQMLGTLVS